MQIAMTAGTRMNNSDHHLTGVAATARQILDNNPVFIDTETTGLGRSAEIVELAILDNQGQELFYSLIKPEGSIHPKAAAVHGITSRRVASAPSFDQVAASVYYLLRGKTIVAHNASFDQGRLDYEFGRVGIELNAIWNCTMRLVANGGKWPKLVDCVKKYGVIPPEGSAHSALYDAECCRRVLHALCDQTSF